MRPREELHQLRQLLEALTSGRMILSRHGKVTNEEDIYWLRRDIAYLESVIARPRIGFLP